MSTSTPAHTNRLAAETSPYLLQHQHNPVDWYPWGEEAFRASRESGKPIFLSVGYSTCYWCHVMERQCFESEAIAEEMNKRFINVKVDREERPDVDQLYMTAVQVLTRQGGWPMSVFLTPDLRPFFGGTYFPPEDMQGRPGFPRLLAGLDDAWQNRRDEVLKTGDQLLNILHQLASPRRPDAPITFDAAKIEEFVARGVADYEPVHGGFGQAPKFPRQTLLRFLLTHIDGPAKRDPALTRRVREMLRHTLDCMDRGGIHDHLGGGFHRYSTDAKWLVPHFEVMLYDQAMLAEVYAVAARVFEAPRYAEVARGICDFVLREMTSPEGAFYTAMDAEVDHYEGLNYLWTEAEIRELLGAEDAALFGCVYGVDQGPNFTDPHANPGGAKDKNILFLDRPLEQAAHDHGIPIDELHTRLAAMRAKLKTARNARKQPLLDTKLLTGWNALMAHAMAVVGRELTEPTYLEAARRNVRLLLSIHRSPDGGLYRTSRGGQAKYAGFLDDYAALAVACFACDDADLAGEGRRLVDQMLVRFGAAGCETCDSGGSGEKPKGTCCGGGGGGCKGGGLFFTDAGADDLIVRQKVSTDSPLPSGNALAVRALLEAGQPERARAVLVEFAQPLDDNAEAMSAMTDVLTRYVRASGPLEVAAAPGAQPRRPATPEELAAAVVHVDARRASDDELQLRLQIADGYHVHGPDAASPFIATRLALEDADVVYPQAERIKLEFAPDELDVYRGEVILTVRLRPGSGGAVKGSLVYQPCDDTACLPPVRRPIEIQF